MTAGARWFPGGLDGDPKSPRTVHTIGRHLSGCFHCGDRSSARTPKCRRGPSGRPQRFARFSGAKSTEARLSGTRHASAPCGARCVRRNDPSPNGCGRRRTTCASFPTTCGSGFVLVGRRRRVGRFVSMAAACRAVRRNTPSRTSSRDWRPADSAARASWSKPVR